MRLKKEFMKPKGEFTNLKQEVARARFVRSCL
jgi:hypothetical protein